MKVTRTGPWDRENLDIYLPTKRKKGLNYHVGRRVQRGRITIGIK